MYAILHQRKEFKIKNVNSTHTEFRASYGNVKTTHTFFGDYKMLQNIENLREKLPSFMGCSNIDSIYNKERQYACAFIKAWHLMHFYLCFSIFKRLLENFEDMFHKILDKKKEICYSSFEIKIRK